MTGVRVYTPDDRQLVSGCLTYLFGNGFERTFLARPIEGEHPYVWLDATYDKIREGGREIQVATVVAVGSQMPVTAACWG